MASQGFPEPPMTNSQREFAELARMLTLEASVVGQLRCALLAQRHALAADNLEGVEGSLRAIHNSLLALGEASRSRTKLLEALAGDPQFPLNRLEGAVDGPLPPHLTKSRDALKAAAEAAAHDASVNYSVLRQVIAANEAVLQTLLCSDSAEPADITLGRPEDDGAPGAAD